METAKTVFNENSAIKLILKFSIPAMIAMIVNELYNMVDSIFVGRTVGISGIGALTIAFPIQTIVIAIGMMIAIGASTLVARELSKGSRVVIDKILHSSINLMIIINLILIIIVVAFMNKILVYLGASEDIVPYAREYLSIIIFGSIFQCFSMIMSQIIVSLGKTKESMICISIGALMNIVLDFLLVIIGGMGVKGAAIATVISQFISAIYVLYKLRKLGYLHKVKFLLDKTMIISIVGVGISAFIVEMSDSIVGISMNRILSEWGGDSSLAIFGIVTKVVMFMYIPIMGIGTGMQPIAAFDYGSKNYDRLREVVKKSLILSFIISIVFWGGAFIFSRDILAIFTNDLTIIDQGTKAFRIVISVFPILSIYYIAICYYQAIENKKISLLLSVYRQVVVFIPVMGILGGVFGLGVLGAWVAFPISDLIASVTSVKILKDNMNNSGVYKEKLA